MQYYDLDEQLKLLYNYSSFRPGQKEIIQDVMQGKNVFGVLPTGSGKSLCYQLPARLMHGTTIVVSPLISLMIDQVKKLKATHFKEVVALNSFMEYTERRQVYKNLNAYKLVYVSPELLQKEELLTHMKKINISLFVIDEAHCISQWGHEFRPDYLKLHAIITLLNNPPVLALSATATKLVQKDIITSLGRPDIVKHIYPMDRENITFCVQEVSGEQEKQTVIYHLLTQYHVPALIYFSSRQTAEQIATILMKQLPNRRIAFYHGGMEQIDRITVQQQFMNDQLEVICCTSAFGMGIDKQNIRLVIHYHYPSQIESFIQEAGRAGRDGHSSVSLLLYCQADYYIPKNLIQNELPTETELKFVFQQLANFYKEQQSLPFGEQEQAELFHLNEIKWRFLNYQFEKHGMLKKNFIFYEEKNWKDIFQSINQHRKNRIRLKENKLSEMIQWVEEKDCLRQTLYKSFQHSYTAPAFHCCSNCGFTFSQWNPEQVTISDDSTYTWKDKLKELLLLGDQV